MRVRSRKLAPCCSGSSVPLPCTFQKPRPPKEAFQAKQSGQTSDATIRETHFRTTRGLLGCITYVHTCIHICTSRCRYRIDCVKRSLKARCTSSLTHFGESGNKKHGKTALTDRALVSCHFCLRHFLREPGTVGVRSVP